MTVALVCKPRMVLAWLRKPGTGSAGAASAAASVGDAAEGVAGRLDVVAVDEERVNAAVN